MAAPVGNQFWKARASCGRGKLFDSPEVLWEAACEYFQWVEDNPLYETKAFAYQGVVTTEELPKMRAMTLGGLCLFLGTNQQTLLNYGTAQGYEDYFDVVKQIKEIIYEQKFTGAAAELLNPNIIARDLKLDKENTGTTIVNNIMPVPVADSVDDWESAAKKNQEDLLNNDR